MEAVISINPGATKWDIRQKVWDYIEANDLANFPRPVHNRIPNFKGAAQACNQLKVLQEFKSSSVVKVNPDKPQEQARYCTLEGAHGACNKVSELEVFGKTEEVKVDPDKPLEGARLLVLEAKKTLLVPTPRLRTGLFNKIVPPQGASKEDLRVCSTSQGVKDFSVPIGLDAKVKVDLVVVGSVAVSEKGYRIGKGEGFADMEYGMMVAMAAVDESTVVVTVVHDCQVVDIPEELIESHDLTVDYILTPTRVIQTGCTRAKPPGIIWSKVDAEMLAKIPILKKLRALEQEAGKDVTLKPSPEGEGKPDRPDRPRREPARGPRRNPIGQSRQAGRRGETQEAAGHDGAEPRPAGQSSVTTVYLGNIPAGVRVSELKGALREREAAPLRLTWQGAQHRAFLDYASQQAAEDALAALQDLTIQEHTLQPEMAKSQRGDRSSRPPGQPRRRRPKAPATTSTAAEATPDDPDTTTTSSSKARPAKPRNRRPTPKGKVEGENQPPPSP